MSKTSNYNLQLDQQSDYYDIDKHNDNYNIIDAAMKNLEDTKAVKGTAYVKGENNVKVIQGVPVGGQFENLGVLAGYLKIKIPVIDHATPFEFDVSIRHVGTENLTAKYRIKAHLPSGNITASYQDVTVIKGTVNDLVVDFCKSATEDYLIFRLATGTKDFGYSSIVIDNIHYRGSTSDFSKDWGISIVTALETLDNTKKSTVTPTLNATTLQGLTWDTAGTITGEANKLFRFSDVANTVKHIFKIMKSSVNAFRVAKDDDTEVFNVDTTNSLLTGLAADKKQDKLKLENNLKVVHGIPIGGQKYFGTENQTGAIKIKLPTARTNTRYSFKVRLRNYTTNANKIFLVSGINYDGGVGSLPAISNYCKVTEISDDTNYASKTVKFYTGLEEDYIVIGGTTDTWDHLAVTVSEVEYFGTGLNVDWSTGWAISMLTLLEDLTSTYYVTVIPRLNATHAREATTQPSGDNSTKIATTEFVNAMLGGDTVPAKVLSENGYAKMANGLIFQWGSNALDRTITFPVAFPTTCLQVIATANSTDYWGASLFSSKSNTSFTVAKARGNGTIWFAIGY